MNLLKRAIRTNKSRGLLKKVGKYVDGGTTGAAIKKGCIVFDNRTPKGKESINSTNTATKI